MAVLSGCRVPSSGNGAESQTLPHLGPAQRGDALRWLTARRELSQQLLGDRRHLVCCYLEPVGKRRIGACDAGDLTDVLLRSRLDLLPGCRRLQTAKLGDVSAHTDRLSRVDQDVAVDGDAL